MIVVDGFDHDRRHPRWINGVPQRRQLAAKLDLLLNEPPVRGRSRLLVRRAPLPRTRRLYRPGLWREKDPPHLVANDLAQRASTFSEVLQAIALSPDFDELNLVKCLDQLQTAIREFFVVANTVHGANERFGKRALVAFRFENAPTR